MRLVSFNGPGGPIFLLFLLGGGLYGFFGPNRLEGCDRLLKPDDWMGANLICPGFSAMQYMVAVGLSLAAVFWIVDIVRR